MQEFRLCVNKHKASRNPKINEKSDFALANIHKFGGFISP
jgi:hypothetical protein